MNKLNKDEQLEKFMIFLKARDEKPSLLLHACCAPCLSACLERVIDYFDLTVYFYNPNITDEKEYLLRKAETERLTKEYGVKFIAEEFSSNAFYSQVKGYEKEREGGKRCELCFNLRLTKTASLLKKISADYFATTLTLSPLKNAEVINLIGKKIERDTGTKYLETDFKKRGGYIRSIELSKKYGLFRQNYCGCEFSKPKEKRI